MMDKYINYNLNIINKYIIIQILILIFMNI